MCACCFWSLFFCSSTLALSQMHTYMQGTPNAHKHILHALQVLQSWCLVRIGLTIRKVVHGVRRGTIQIWSRPVGCSLQFNVVQLFLRLGQLLNSGKKVDTFLIRLQNLFGSGRIAKASPNRRPLLLGWRPLLLVASY